jgi:hypothetical protein
MAHNNSTPAAIITAPVSVPKPIVTHTPVVDEKGKETGAIAHGNHTTTGQTDPVTGVYRNPQRAERKARAALKRRRRNKARRSNYRNGDNIR